MPTTYPTRVTSLQRCGEDVVLGQLARPDGYEYRAGQWFRLTLGPQGSPETRTFSHSASPSDSSIEFGTRLSASSFKQALARLGVGDEVQISGPGGRLALPDSDSPLAFLAGGVGITPVRSLLRAAAAEGRDLGGAVLLYGNRDSTCIPYGEELEAMKGAGLSIVRVLERPPEQWEGESGFITAELVRRHADPDDHIFVVSGPPVMVDAMERVLDEVGVPPQRRIVESFGPRA